MMTACWAGLLRPSGAVLLLAMWLRQHTKLLAMVDTWSIDARAAGDMAAWRGHAGGMAVPWRTAQMMMLGDTVWVVAVNSFHSSGCLQRSGCPAWCLQRRLRCMMVWGSSESRSQLAGCGRRLRHRPVR